MKPHLLLALSLLCAFPVLADPPAAVQICVRLPEGLALFGTAPGDHLRALNATTWMLDFEVLLNGRRPTRLSRGTGDCLRAWLPAEHLRTITLDLAKLSLNPVTVEHAVDLPLKPDLLSEGGTFVLERQPWSTATSSMGGELVFERQTPQGGAVVTDLQQLPEGKYLVRHIPAEATKSACAVTIDAIGVGTVRADRHEPLFAELVAHYRKELLPSVIARHKLRCEPGESVRLSLRLVDGVFQSPLDPPLERVRDPGAQAHYRLVIDGESRAFESGLELEVGFGQRLEFSRLEQRASAD